MVTHYLDFFSIFSGRKFENYINQLQSHIFWVQSPPPQKKCDNGGFEPGSLTRPATSGCRTISPFTASAWERVGIEKEFKYTYLQYTYTTAGDTNGNSNVSWVWYLGVLTCIVKRLFSLQHLVSSKIIIKGWRHTHIPVFVQPLLAELNSSEVSTVV